MREIGFDLWVGKIPWRRARLPTPVFCTTRPGDGRAQPDQVTDGHNADQVRDGHNPDQVRDGHNADQVRDGHNPDQVRDGHNPDQVILWNSIKKSKIFTA